MLSYNYNGACSAVALSVAAKPMCLLSQEMAHMKRDRPRMMNMTRMFVPECEDDGTFRPKQCHPLTSECWCVDDRGKEIYGTRMAVKSGEEDLLQCSKQN